MAHLVFNRKACRVAAGRSWHSPVGRGNGLNLEGASRHQRRPYEWARARGMNEQGDFRHFDQLQIAQRIYFFNASRKITPFTCFMKVKCWACAAPLFRHELPHRPLARPDRRVVDPAHRARSVLGHPPIWRFQTHLGIAPNVLTQRLTRLVEGGILEVTSESQIGRALEYRLTAKGLELMPILVALAQWGNRHTPGPDGAHTRIVERQTGRDIAPSPSCQPRDSRFNPGTLPWWPDRGVRSGQPTPESTGHAGRRRIHRRLEFGHRPSTMTTHRVIRLRAMSVRTMCSAMRGACACRITRTPP